MLNVNGKNIDFTNKDPKYQFRAIVDNFHKNISELKERHGGAVLFVTPSRDVRLDPITKIPRKPKPYSWPYKTTVNTPDGSQEWVWSASAPKVKDGVATPNEANFIIARGERTLSLTEEADLIFFLQQTRAFKRGRLSIYDADKVEDMRAEKIISENKLKDMLYSEYSPLFKDRAKMNMLAGKWGIANASAMTDNAIRNLLHDTVLRGEGQKRKNVADSRGIQDFVKDVAGSESTRIGSDVQYAMDQDLLYYDKTPGQWKLVAVNSDTPIVLMDVGKTSAPIARNKLIEFLLESEHDADLLSKAIHGGVKLEYGQVAEVKEDDPIVLTTDVTLENLFDKDEKDKYIVKFTTLQKTLKELGVKQFGGSDEVVRNMVREELEKLAESET